MIRGKMANILKVHASDSWFSSYHLNRNEDLSKTINWISQPGAKVNKRFKTSVIEGVKKLKGPRHSYINLRLSVGINEFTTIKQMDEYSIYIYNGIDKETFLKKLITFKHEISLSLPSAVITFSSIPPLDILKYNLCQIDDDIYGSKWCEK